MRLNPTNISIIKRLLVGRNNRPLKAILSKVPAGDLASLLTTLNEVESRNLFDGLMSIDKASDVLQQMPEPQLLLLLRRLEKNKLMALINFSPEAAAAYFLSLMEAEERDGVLESLDSPKRVKLRQFLNYPEDSAGRIMATEVFSMPWNLTAQEGLEYLRSRAQHESIYYIYCIDESRRLMGVVSLRALATAPADRRLSEIAKKDDIVSVAPTTSMREVADIVRRYNFIAVPVVDSENHLLGLITVDDVLDLIQEQATANVYAVAGLQEDDRVYTPIRESIKRRLPWMIINLATAFLASSVVGMFEATMGKMIVLATLNPIVAGMGGNAAIQTLTVVTRGLATDDFNFISRTQAVLRQAVVGLSIGAVTGTLAGTLIYVWVGSPMIALVMVIAMMINSMAAACAGAMIPLVLNRLKWDPAVGSGVIVTTVTDCVGFSSFLGIATLGLRLIGEG